MAENPEIFSVTKRPFISGPIAHEVSVAIASYSKSSSPLSITKVYPLGISSS